MIRYPGPLPPEWRDDPRAQRLQRFLADWISRYPGWAWTTIPSPINPNWTLSRRPRSENEVGADLVQDIDFLAVGLADWLRSPDGELVTAVVGTLGLTPEDAELLIDAVRIAGYLQQASGQRRAGIGALVALVAFVIALAALLDSSF